MRKTILILDLSINEEFWNSISLFTTNDNVNINHKNKLHAFKWIITHSITIKVERKNPYGAQNIKIDVELLVAIDAKVMLTSNLWREVGLIDWFLRYIWSIIYCKYKSWESKLKVTIKHLT